jgi:hypothetical protein
VDNSVENSATFPADAHSVGFLSDLAGLARFKKVNQIKYFA